MCYANNSDACKDSAHIWKTVILDLGGLEKMYSAMARAKSSAETLLTECKDFEDNITDNTLTKQIADKALAKVADDNQALSNIIIRARKEPKQYHFEAAKLLCRNPEDALYASRMSMSIDIQKVVSEELKEDPEALLEIASCWDEPFPDGAIHQLYKLGYTKFVSLHTKSKKQGCNGFLLTLAKEVGIESCSDLEVGNVFEVIEVYKTLREREEKEAFMANLEHAIKEGEYFEYLEALKESMIPEAKGGGNYERSTA